MGGDDMPEHACEIIYEPDMLDAAKCSCGWQSKWYYDGREFAYDAWKRHAREAHALALTNGQSGGAT